MNNFNYRIHFTLPDGTEDFVELHTDTLEELQEQAATEVAKRNAIDYWSERI